jgi:hypothetical protein
MDDLDAIDSKLVFEMFNAAGAPLRCPGFGDLPVYHEVDLLEAFNDGASGWMQSPRLTARELAMLAVMNCITDTEDWHVNIFDVEKVENWRRDASLSTLAINLNEHKIVEWGEVKSLAMPLMSQKAWEWCLNELRDKVAAFVERGFLRVLDAGSCVCKSDSLVLNAIPDEFKDALAHLRSGKGDQALHVERIADLVDPSMYPLVYGSTGYLAGGQQVKLDRCVETCFSPELKIAPTQSEPTISEAQALANPAWHHWVRKVTPILTNILGDFNGYLAKSNTNLTRRILYASHLI